MKTIKDIIRLKAQISGIIALFSGAIVFPVLTGCTRTNPTEFHPHTDSEVLNFVARIGGSDWYSTRTESNNKDTVSFPIVPEKVSPENMLYLQVVVSNGFGDETESDSVLFSEVETRSAPITTSSFTGPFGVSAYYIPKGSSWSEALLPEWMYNVKVADEDNGIWSPSSDYLWPGTGNLRFFAYCPYNSETLNTDGSFSGTEVAGFPILSSENTAGSPKLYYDVPSDVSKQTDILVASTENLSEGTTPLFFKHALSAIKFVTGSNLTSCTLKSVSVEGIACNGIYSFSSGTWDLTSQTRNYSQTLNKSVDNTSGVAVTTSSQTFMLMPQTLPEGAKITAVLNNGTSDLTLTASIAGTTWEAGKTYTYRISRNSFTIDWTFYPNGTHNEGSSEGNLVWNTSKTYHGNALRNISANGEPYRLTISYPSTVTSAIVRLRYDDYIKTDANDDGTPDNTTGGADTQVLEYFGSGDVNPRTQNTIPLHLDKGKTVLEGYTCFLNKGTKSDTSTNLYYARQWSTKAVVEAKIVSSWAFVVTDADGNTSTYDPASDSDKWFTLWEGNIYPPNYFSYYDWQDLGDNFYGNGDPSAGHLWARYDNSYTLRAVSASSSEIVYRAEGGYTTWSSFNRNRHSEIKGHPIYGRADGLDASDNTASSSTDISPDPWEVPDWDYGTRILGLVDFIKAIDYQSQINDVGNVRMNDIFGHRYYDGTGYGDYGTAKYTSDEHTDIIAVSGETVYNSSTLLSLTSSNVYSTGKFEHYGKGKELLVRLVIKKYGMPDLNAEMPYARAWKNSTYRYCNDVTDNY